MNTSVKWIFHGILIVGLISLISLGFAAKPVAEEVLQDNLMAKPVGIETVNLHVETAKQSENISYGTRSEVYRFVLSADDIFSVRYLTFHLEQMGLDMEEFFDAGNWELYNVIDGKVDYSKKLGTGESFEGSLLQVRLNPFFGDAGANELVLVGSIIRDATEDEDVKIRVLMPFYLQPQLNWKWVPGKYSGSWLTLDESYGVEKVVGLPTLAVERM